MTKPVPNHAPILDPASSLPVPLPDGATIKQAVEIEDPLERTRNLYQLSLRYRELGKEALEAAKVAANDANAVGHVFGKVAAYAGAASASSLSKAKR